MKPQIASIHERMKQGGDWRAFRDEIATLHAEANTEEEYVTLLEAHRNLVAVGKFAYDEGTYAKLLPIAEAEYRSFLQRESMEGEALDPTKFERVTRREVAAGRLDANDDFRKLAVSGPILVADHEVLDRHNNRPGNWFFSGMSTAAVLATGLATIPLSPLWLILVGLIVGWILNEHERKSNV